MIKGIKLELNNPKGRIEKSMERGQKILDDKVLKDSNFYIPADTWNARDSGTMHTKIGSGQVVWQTPYIREIYYNPNKNFSKDKNPNAQGLWFEVAKAEKLKDWLKDTERQVRNDM